MGDMQPIEMKFVKKQAVLTAEQPVFQVPVIFHEQVQDKTERKQEV